PRGSSPSTWSYVRFSLTMKNTCLIGPFGRIGVFLGGCCWFSGWIWRSARGVSRRIWLSPGKRRMPELPRTIDGRYWKLLMKSSESFGEFGLGPWGLGPTPSPRAEIQASLPLAERAAATVG